MSFSPRLRFELVQTVLIGPFIPLSLNKATFESIASSTLRTQTSQSSAVAALGSGSYYLIRIQMLLAITLPIAGPRRFSNLRSGMSFFIA